MNKNFSRRDFLKLASLLPAAYYLPPSIKVLPASEEQTPPNILVLIFDAWSIENTSLYGYPRKTTPNLDRLAEKAIVYHNHYVSGSFTYPSTSSLLTGVMPWTHWGYWNTPRSEILEEYSDKNIFSLFDSHYRYGHSNNILASDLIERMVSHMEAFLPAIKLAIPNHQWYQSLFHKDPDTSIVSWSRELELSEEGYANSLFLSRLYSHIRDKRQKNLSSLFPRGLPEISEKDNFILETEIDWISDTLKTSKTPFFSYFHLLPPHSTYNTRWDFVDVFKDDGYEPLKKPFHPFSLSSQTYPVQKRNRRLYDEYILYADSEFGRLMENLRASGVLENTILILTSDHGEMFERGIREHLFPSFHEPQAHIPLLIFRPGQQERIDIHDLTTTIDLLPTILQLSNKSFPDWLEGIVLPPFNPNVPKDRSVFGADFRYVPKFKPLANGSVMLRKEQYKLTFLFGNYQRYQNLGAPTLFALYDLENDPEEMKDLYHPQSELSSSLLDELLAKMDQVGLELGVAL